MPPTRRVWEMVWCHLSYQPTRIVLAGIHLGRTMCVPSGRTLSQMIGQRQTGKLIPSNYKIWLNLHGRAVLRLPYPPALRPVSLPNKSLACQLGGDSLLWLTSWPLGYSGTSLPIDAPQNPKPVIGTPGNGLTRMPLLGKEQETLFDLSTFLSALLLNPSYPTVFFLSPGFGLRNLVKESQPELRVWGRSPLVYRELKFWFYSSLDTSRVSSSLLQSPGKSPVTSGICTWQQTAVVHPVCLSSPPPSSSSVNLPPLLHLQSRSLEIFHRFINTESEVLWLHRRFSERM